MLNVGILSLFLQENPILPPRHQLLHQAYCQFLSANVRETITAVCSVTAVAMSCVTRKLDIDKFILYSHSSACISQYFALMLLDDCLWNEGATTLYKYWIVLYSRNRL